jgi:hypothetical protein
MRRSGKGKPVVWRWQARFMAEGVAGLTRDKTRKPGKPPLPAATVQRVVDLALSATATTTRGTFRSSRLDERQVVHRFIAQADLKLRAARAFMPTTRPRT